ncbi:MAG: hypothetical protein J6Q02_09655 [Lachnospiraceae bacterium]|nr:hypothetical protein [Lachnospiraceae bacterium]
MRRAETLKAALNSQAYHWAMFPLILIILESPRPSGFILLGFIITGTFPLVLFLAREFAKSFVLQLIFLPVLAGILLLLPIEPGSMKLIFALFALAYLIASLLTSIHKDDESNYKIPPFIPLLLNLIFSGIAVIYCKFEFTFIMHIATILSLVGAVLAYYMDGYIVFTRSNEGIASNMPKGKILRSGLTGNAKYFGATILLALLVSSFSVSNEFFWSIQQKLRELWVKLIWAIRSLFGRGEEPTEAVLEDGKFVAEELEMLQIDRETSPIARITEVILFFVVAAVLAFVLIKIIIALVRFLMGNAGTKVFLDQEDDDEPNDERESLTQTVIYNAPEDDDRFLSPSRRIRRLYQKRALATSKASHDLGRMTAREFAAEEKNELMALIYEKARYSTEVCTNDDVKRMQQAVRRKS